MKSCIYTGRIYHKRYAPVEHGFSYRMFMMHVDLSERDALFDGKFMWSQKRFAPARFKRSDYHGPADMPLDEAVRATVQNRVGFRPEGRIELLTHLRYFGYIFNPVSFYFCYDEQDALCAIMAEITNTPWKERHAYVMDCRESALDGRPMNFVFGKEFHISPFMPMDIGYRWSFSAPGGRLGIYMANMREGKKVFDATLKLERKEATASAMNMALIGYPLMTLRVVTGIYWQALKLKMKGVPAHRHPASARRAELAYSTGKENHES